MTTTRELITIKFGKDVGNCIISFLTSEDLSSPSAKAITEIKIATSWNSWRIRSWNYDLTMFDHINDYYRSTQADKDRHNDERLSYLLNIGDRWNQIKHNIISRRLYTKSLLPLSGYIIKNLYNDSFLLYTRPGTSFMDWYFLEYSIRKTHGKFYGLYTVDKNFYKKYKNIVLTGSI